MNSKILVPVDTGRNSLTAEEYAIRLSWKMPLRVTLLNIINTGRLEGHGISPDDQDRIRRSMRKRAEAVLAQAAAPFQKADIEYETRIAEGRPGDLICKIGEQEGFDMIIIAQSGLSEWEELLGGSVVHTVLQRSPVPVLLVKHTKEQLDTQRKMRAEQELLPR